MEEQGLYDPAFEHDACGVAFVARLGAPPSHEVVSRALDALERLEHRGAAGRDADTGDGAGMLIRIPTTLFCGDAGSLPRARRLRRRGLLPAAERDAAAELEELLEPTVGRGPARARLARRPGRRRHAAA